MGKTKNKQRNKQKKNKRTRRIRGGAVVEPPQTEKKSMFGNFFKKPEWFNKPGGLFNKPGGWFKQTSGCADCI